MGDFDELRQAISEAGTAFRKGSGVLVSRGAAWIRQDLFWHGGIAAGGLYFAVFELHKYPDVVMYGLPVAVVVWTGAAWSVTPDEDQDADEDADEDPDDVEDEDDEDEAEPVAPLSRDDLAVACHAIGAPHAHIVALAQHLDTTTDRVRECCSSAGITIGDVRMRGRRVSTGIAAADFPPLPPPPEGAAVGEETAGQRTNNNTRWYPDGTRITTRPDPDRPARTIVTIKKGNR